MLQICCERVSGASSKDIDIRDEYRPRQETEELFIEVGMDGERSRSTDRSFPKRVKSDVGIYFS